MLKKHSYPPHLSAVLQAVFVTFLWSTSWVFIKIGLKSHLPPLTFAGLRYTIAFLCLLPFLLIKKEERQSVKQLNRREWLKLSLLGVVFYSLTQGTQFLSLAFLPAAMVSMFLNLTSVFVALSGIFLLKEYPAPIQWAGIAAAAGGIAVYFLPAGIAGISTTGILITFLCVASNTASAVMGRHINHKSRLSPLVITFVSMGIGSLLLLAAGIIFQGTGEISITDWLIIIWLAVANTAFAFTLWNKSLKVLTAVESSILNSLMLPQIALLALVFLGETLSIKQIAGLVLVSVGVLLVQLKKNFLKPARTGKQ